MTVPNNIEAEQQLLGALLLDPEKINVLGASGSADLFYDPVHADLFSAIIERHKRGDNVSPVSLKAWADGHQGAKELGGAKYLVRLAGASIAGFAVRDYADILGDLATKRSILQATAETAEGIKKDETAGVVIGRLEASLASLTGGRKSEPISMTKAATEALEEAASAYQGHGANATPTYIPELDRIVGGFRPGELILLGGRPSMGKTAIALAIAKRVAESGDGVCIASLEMQAPALAHRLMSEESASTGKGISYSSILRGEISEDQMRTVVHVTRRVADLPIQILPPDFRDIGALYAGAKRANGMTGGLGLMVVDYLQLLRAPGRSRIEQIAEISIALKGLAMSLNVPILALSQLSRAVESRENKRPVLSDLRESGQLEQDADTVLFAYRDEYYLEREKPEEHELDDLTAWEDAMQRSRNRLEIIVAKQRQGRVDTARVRFNPALNLIWSDEQ